MILASTSKMSLIIVAVTSFLLIERIRFIVNKGDAILFIIYNILDNKILYSFAAWDTATLV